MAARYRIACVAIVLIPIVVTVLAQGRGRVTRTAPALPARVDPIDFEIKPWDGAIPERARVAAALRPLEPFFEYRRVYDLMHALQLWGAHAEFTAPAAFPIPDGLRPMSSRDVIGFLLDDAPFRKYNRDRSLLVETDHGVSVAVGVNPAESAHVDKHLKVFSEIGLPLDTPVSVGGTRHTLADLLSESLARYTPLQEIEFSAVGFARYLPPRTSWVNRFGETFTFDDLAEELLSRPPGVGSCYGLHFPYAMTTLLRVDQVTPILAPATRSQLSKRLRKITDRLERVQLPSGAWDRRCWAEPIEIRLEESARLEQIRVTSHQLEWMAFAPEGLRVGPKTARKALGFLCNELDRLEAGVLSLSHEFPVLSHAGRALTLASGYTNAGDFQNHSRDIASGGAVPAGR